MQILWNLGKGFVRDIREQMTDPRPAYNTVSTIVRILEKKGFVSHQAYGNAHQYFPLVTKTEYSKNRIKSLLKNYFKNSYSELVSFFAREQNMSVREMEEIMQIMDQQIKNQQDTGYRGESETKNSDKSTNPGESTNPANSSNPGESTNSANSSNPKKNTKPDNNTNSDNSANQDNAASGEGYTK